MTIKELIPKLIAHYEKCINEMPEKEWIDYMYDKDILYGVCYLSYYKFNKELVGSRFMKKFTYGKMYLCEKPRNAISYSEVKELLQIRLKRLKEFL